MFRVIHNEQDFQQLQNDNNKLVASLGQQVAIEVQHV